MKVSDILYTAGIRVFVIGWSSAVRYSNSFSTLAGDPLNAYGSIEGSLNTVREEYLSSLVFSRSLSFGFGVGVLIWVSLYSHVL